MSHQSDHHKCQHHHIEGLGCSCCSPLWKHIIPKNLHQSVPQLSQLNEPKSSQDRYQLFEADGCGTIETVAQGKSHQVDALLVKNDKIFAVGDLKDVMEKFTSQPHITAEDERYLENDRIKISDSQTLLPGLIEPHVHILPTAWFDTGVDLGPFEGQYLKDNYNRDAVLETLNNNVQCILDSKQDPTKTWIIGNLLDPSLFNGGPREFDKQVLDSVSDQIPMFIMNASMHFAYVNQAAINTLDGKIEVPSNGVLSEMDEILPFVENSSISISVKEVNSNVDDNFTLASSRGITYMHDAGIMPDLKDKVANQVTYLKIKANQPTTPVRIGGALVVEDLNDIEQITDKNPKNYLDNHNINITFIKIVSDGSNQGLTGKLTQEYDCNDDYEVVEHSDNCGEFNYSDIDEFNNMVVNGCDSNWSLMIHANGDDAIDTTLNAYAKSPENNSKRRHRIEHASLLDNDSLERMEQYHISPSFLIGHVGYWGYVFKNTIFGKERANYLDRCKSALNKDMRITLHSDNSVTPLGPLRQMEQSITRIMEGAPTDSNKHKPVLNQPEQLSRFEALKAVTYDAAWQCNMEEHIGSLEVDKFADMVLLEQSPLTYGDPDNNSSAQGMRDIKVLKTFKGGKQVHPKPI